MLFSNSFIAQKESKFYGSFDFKLPTSVTNTSFKGIMGGLADLNGTVTYRVLPKLEVGIGVKYSYFEVNTKAFQTSVNGQMELFGANASIVYTTEMNETWSFEGFLHAGPQKGISKSNLFSGSYKQNSIFIQPGFGIYVKSSENLSFGLTSGYSITTNGFTPDNLGLDNFPSLSAETSKGSIGYFSIGFGFKARIAKAEGLN